ncbi:hypothetical protein BFINE_23420 [Bacteroides finegoldii DSM 17565]|nr:hypothetical protein BFINE_23420 [Bacteroides finegoldii DSM 17565]
METTFEGFDWSSNGWTGEALKLTNGAKAVIGYRPFATDVKSTGLTIELTLRVSNPTDSDTAVVDCLDSGKGLYITPSEASFKTGEKVSYTNEDDELVEREIKLGTNYVEDRWIKVALMVGTRNESRLMELYVDGNRTGADIYDNAFSFRQDNPKYITIDSAGADVEVKSVRIYTRRLSDDEELENRMVDSVDGEEMIALYEENDILGDTDTVDMDKLRAKGKGCCVSCARTSSMTCMPRTTRRRTFRLISSITPLSDPNTTSCFVTVISVFRVPVPRNIRARTSVSISARAARTLASPLAARSRRKRNIPSVPVASP